MPRSKKIRKKLSEPDLVYKNRMVTKLINKVMLSGRKPLAEKIVYRAFKQIEEKEKSDSLATFNEALKNVMPKMEVKSRRVGGASYQIPVEVRGVRKDSLAIRWLVDAARARPNKEFKTMEDKLAAEILAASRGEGEAVKKRENTHRMAEANKAFAHFRW